MWRDTLLYLLQIIVGAIISIFVLRIGVESVIVLFGLKDDSSEEGEPEF